MAKEIADHTDVELQNLIANYRRLERTSEPRYVDALEELQRRKGGGLNFEKSLALIRKAASERRFLSYKALADESGADWARVHYGVTKHLGDLIEFAHLKGWPLLSAIVVNAKGVETGEMEAATLDGFVKAARGLGYDVTDHETFLREQQERVFAWAAEAAADV